jgi:D-serine deaminase-like pyridoxal phosphate-dependent protein
MTAEWSFTDTFRRSDPRRVQRLERSNSLERIVAAILATRPVVDVSGMKSHPKSYGRLQRVEFCLRLRPDVLDAFFNGSSGYRAELLRVGSAASGDIDRWIVQRIAATYSVSLAAYPAHYGR